VPPVTAHRTVGIGLVIPGLAGLITGEMATATKGTGGGTALLILLGIVLILGGTRPLREDRTQEVDPAARAAEMVWTEEQVAALAADTPSPGDEQPVLKGDVTRGVAHLSGMAQT
jgi:hypothetical protein